MRHDDLTLTPNVSGLMGRRFFRNGERELSD